MDLDFAVGWNLSELTLVVTGGAVGVDAVTEYLHSPVAFSEETEIQGEVTGFPIIERTDVPNISAAAGKGNETPEDTVHGHALVPDSRAIRDVLRALRLGHIVDGESHNIFRGESKTTYSASWWQRVPWLIASEFTG